MRLQQTKLQQSKAFVHIAQVLLIFIAGCLSVVILTKNGSTDGRIGWFFGLCFLTIPAVVYQIMVPMWSRAWRFANDYAYAAIDVLFAILWFSAFVAVASWVSAGKSLGSKDQKKPASCDVFAFGSASKCTTGEADIAFGVLILYIRPLPPYPVFPSAKTIISNDPSITSLLFLATSALSVRQAIRHRQSGALPGTDAGGAYTATAGLDDHTKDAWSADTGDLHADDPYHPDDEHDDETTDHRGPHRGTQIPHDDDDEHALLSAAESPGQQDVGRQYTERPESWETDVHPGRPLSWGTERGSGSFARIDTEYRGAGGQSDSGVEGKEVGRRGSVVQMPDEEMHRIPSALSPGGYEDGGVERRPVEFPAANY
ncbi:MAG: hypothetical protein M1821_008806 [Bathelium mastoideum]|nr:MAG: hypothetical protein M1821_008806 [Bathelium mastoideum]KAI9687617.1 MAG: hypothetical protein M1822_002227 [Bathelium mastoideum]